MRKKSNKRSNKGKKTRKQKLFVMIGCSKKNKKSCRNKKVSTLGNESCPNCGPNCHCGVNCKCPHPCPGTCYLNRRIKKQKGGSGCGSCGCPLSPLSWNQMKMNKFGGGFASYPKTLEQPVIIAPPKGGYQDIIGIHQKGGSCSTCGQTPVMPQSGGNFFKSTGPMPGPIVGKEYSMNNLPGEKGIGGDANYYKPYNTNNDPALQMSMNDAGYLTKNSMVGGYIYNKKSQSSKRGGGLIPQDLVNLGRDFSYNFKTAYNALNGYKAPVDPAPYKGQLTGALNNNRFYTT